MLVITDQNLVCLYQAMRLGRAGRGRWPGGDMVWDTMGGCQVARTCHQGEQNQARSTLILDYNVQKISIERELLSACVLFVIYVPSLLRDSESAETQPQPNLTQSQQQ